jgi:hypothetical protein
VRITGTGKRGFVLVTCVAGRLNAKPAALSLCRRITVVLARTDLLCGHYSVCKTCININKIFFRNYALLQHSFCRVTNAFEYGEEA